MDFHEELAQRLSDIGPEMRYARTLAFQDWGQYLFASGIDRAEQLTDAQVAFLTLFSEKYQTGLCPDLHTKVHQYFLGYYEETGVPEDLEIVLQGLNIRNVDSGAWAIHFEDNTVDPLVIADFNEWIFKGLTLVG